MTLPLLAERSWRGELQRGGGGLLDIGGVDEVRKNLCLLKKVLKSLGLVMDLWWWALIRTPGRYPMAPLTFHSLFSGHKQRVEQT